jgi:hypothetical protein
MLRQLHNKEAKNQSRVYKSLLNSIGGMCLIAAVCNLGEGTSLLALNQKDFNIHVRQICILVSHGSFFAGITLTETYLGVSYHREHIYTLSFCFSKIAQSYAPGYWIA